MPGAVLRMGIFVLKGGWRVWAIRLGQCNKHLLLTGPSFVSSRPFPGSLFKGEDPLGG